MSTKNTPIQLELTQPIRVDSTYVLNALGILRAGLKRSALVLKGGQNNMYDIHIQPNNSMSNNGSHTG